MAREETGCRRRKKKGKAMVGGWGGVGKVRRQAKLALEKDKSGKKKKVEKQTEEQETKDRRRMNGQTTRMQMYVANTVIGTLNSIKPNTDAAALNSSSFII